MTTNNAHTRLQSNDTPAKPYTEVESDFIKQRIKESDFKNKAARRYINLLIDLERYVLKTSENSTWPGYSGGFYYGRITDKYEAQYDRIQQELKPNDYRERKQEEQEKREELRHKQQRRRAKEKKELQEAETQWETVQQEVEG